MDEDLVFFTTQFDSEIECADLYRTYKSINKNFLLYLLLTSPVVYLAE